MLCVPARIVRIDRKDGDHKGKTIAFRRGDLCAGFRGVYRVQHIDLIGSSCKGGMQ
jgi:hypothetical protein